MSSKDFPNDKKTFLAKLDKSKKGGIDERVIPVLDIINSSKYYYTTSSCSGRVYLWRGHEKKNTMQWLKVSHDLISEDFISLKELEDKSGLIWLRLEDFIIHICCKDIKKANLLLEEVRKIYKKSCILSASNKIIVEIRGSENIEMPVYLNNKMIFCGDIGWLVKEINGRLEKIWAKTGLFAKEIKAVCK